MLERHIGECMVSTINKITVSKNLPLGIKIVIQSQILILGGYLKV